MHNTLSEERTRQQKNKTHLIFRRYLFMKNMTMKQRLMQQWEAYGEMLLRADRA